jgi:hypothetical protein
MATLTDKVAVTFWFFVIFILPALIIWFILPNRWTDLIVYSTVYSVSTRQVHWNDKPTDCDWGHAPLGDKGCHYKKSVTAYNAAGNVVAGDDAPTYGKDTKTGKPIISYDNGKTWTWLPEDAPTASDLQVKSVDIGWIKVTEP